MPHNQEAVTLQLDYSNHTRTIWEHLLYFKRKEDSKKEKWCSGLIINILRHGTLICIYLFTLGLLHLKLNFRVTIQE